MFPISISYDVTFHRKNNFKVIVPKNMDTYTEYPKENVPDLVSYLAPTPGLFQTLRYSDTNDYYKSINTLPS